MSPMSPRLLRPRQTGFDPRSISGLVAWWDAADDKNVTLNGSNVSQLTDKSGNGNHLTQNTAGAQPAYSLAKHNNRNAVTGASGRVLTCSVAWPSAVSLFVVCTRSSSSGYLFGGNGPSAIPAIISAYNGDFEWFNDAADRIAIAGTGVAGTGLNILAATQTDGSALRLYRNGTQVTSKTPPSVALSGRTLGAVLAANSIPQATYVGDLGEILFYQQVLSDTQRSAVTAYLGTKWGVTVT